MSEHSVKRKPIRKQAAEKRREEFHKTRVLLAEAELGHRVIPKCRHWFVSTLYRAIV